jgi:hypothetical protein
MGTACLAFPSLITTVNLTTSGVGLASRVWPAGLLVDIRAAGQP